MDLSFSQEDLAFQREVRDWLADNLTEDLKQEMGRSPQGDLSKESQVVWQKRLHERGWIGVNWPTEYGGPGFTRTERYLFDAEMARVGAPGVLPFGLTMVAPVIMKFGTQEQKDRFLPDILATNVWWCQGYSEPGSGSDLASLRTKAEDKDDHFLINGSKTWTTKAQHADWMFCLVRTSVEGKRQQGISFVLIDMHSPGVAVQPIINLDGVGESRQEINTVFLENVKVPKENLVGEVGQGWTCAKYLLEFERGNAYSASLYSSLEKLRDIVGAEPSGFGHALSDEEFSRELSQIEIEIMALEGTELRILGSLATGQNVGPESSLLKTRGTEIGQMLTELTLKAVGYASQPHILNLDRGSNLPDDRPEYARYTAERYFNYRKASIYAGSNEIQRNIMAKLVLGL